jgi:hypothetical protein
LGELFRRRDFLAESEAEERDCKEKNNKGKDAFYLPYWAA